MAERLENLIHRVAQLEHLIEEREMERRNREQDLDRLVARLWAGIPFSAWLKISGPTFAVIAAGASFLWSAQQQTTERIVALQQSTSAQILELQRETKDQIKQLQRETTDQILQHQRETTDQILQHQRETTDQIMQLQRETTGRMLDLQGQLIELQRGDRV